MRRLLPLLLLCACIHSLPPASADRKALDALESAWHAAGLPDTGDCLKRVEVRRHGTRAAYVDDCEGMTPELGRLAGVETSAGCLTSALRGWPGKTVVVIHLAPSFHDDLALVQHEAIHRLVACVLDRPRSDPWDAQHSDPRIWETGGAGSVQVRARRAGK